MTAQTFAFTGSVQSYLVPAGVTAIQVEVWGAQGGGSGGPGGYSIGVLPVTPGEVLSLYVGGSGGTVSGGSQPGGFNGGGRSGAVGGFAGGGGTDVRQGGTALTNRVIVAGGGGGSRNFGVGYGGGGFYGQGGASQPGGSGYNPGYYGTGGGGQSGGGAAPWGGGTGALGQGGNGSDSANAYGGDGGGGGYYGGGGGGARDDGLAGDTNGGGGSGYLGPTLTYASYTTATRSGHGQIVITQVTPNAPTLVAPATNQVLQGATVNRFSWTFSSPITFDSQSGFDLQYRLLGAATWSVINGSTPFGYVDLPAGTLSTPGNYEWQVRTYETQGQVGPYSGSGFFTVATPTSAPTITAPISGATIAIANAILTWSTPAAQTSYQVRKVADNAGAADTATVIYDSNEVVSTSLRAHALTFATNNTYEHLEIRIKVAGLWSPWADIRVQIAFTQPAAPVILLTPDNGVAVPFRPPTIGVAAGNPTPVGGQPLVVSMDIYRSDDGLGTYRIAKNLAPTATYIDYTPASGVDYAYRIRVFAANGVYADSALTSSLIHVSPDTYGGYDDAY